MLYKFSKVFGIYENVVMHSTCLSTCANVDMGYFKSQKCLWIIMVESKVENNESWKVCEDGNQTQVIGFQNISRPGAKLL